VKFARTRRVAVITVIAALITLIVGGGTVSAQEIFAQFWESGVLVDPSIEINRFGASMDLDGNFLVVGAPTSYVNGVLTGAAFVFQYIDGIGWRQDAVLLPDATTSGADFGLSVSIEGGTIAVGAPDDGLDSAFAGAVFIFTRHGSGQWTQTQRLNAPTGAQAMGCSIDVENNVLAAGALGDDRVASNAGAVIVFHRDGGGSWSLEDEILCPIVENNAWFGSTVAVNGDRLFARDWESPPVGAVHVYNRAPDGQWSHHTMLQESDPATRSTFGTSIAFMGERVLIGAPRAYNAAPATTTAGAVYAFERTEQDAYVETGKIARPELSLFGFGQDLSVFGDYLLLSHAQGTALTRWVYIYEPDGAQWVQVGARFDPAGSYSEYGLQVVMHSQFAIIADPGSRIDFFETRQKLGQGIRPAGLPDITGDGIVDGFDLAVLLAGWGS